MAAPPYAVSKPKAPPTTIGGYPKYAVAKPTPINPAFKMTAQEKARLAPMRQAMTPAKPGAYATPSPQPAPGSPPAANPYDYTGDPILQQVLGMNQLNLSTAGSQRTEDQKKSLLGFGSTELAKKLFGNDAAFLQAVGGNPYSTLSNIAHQYEGPTGAINQANESENQNNLFFSSHRLNQVLPELYRQRGQDTYTATNQEQDNLDQINRNYVSAQQQAANAEIQARQEAAQRAVQAALASGYGPGASQSGPAPWSQPQGSGGEYTPFPGKIMTG